MGQEESLNTSIPVITGGVTDSIRIYSKAEQLRNAHFSIVKILTGITIFLNDLQFENVA